MGAISYDRFVAYVSKLKERAYVPAEFWEALLLDTYTCYDKGKLPYTDGFELKAMTSRVRNRCQNYYGGRKVTLKYVGEVYKRGFEILDGAVPLESVGDVVDDAPTADAAVDVEYSVKDSEIVNALLGLCAGKSKLVNHLYKELIPLMNPDDKERFDALFAEASEMRKKNKRH